MARIDVGRVGFGGSGRKGRRIVAALALLSLLLGACICVPVSSEGGAEEAAQDAGDPVRGRVLFEARCAACHGTGGVGTDQGPPLVHPFYRSNHHPDAAFYAAVRNGVQPHHWRFGPMPPQPGLSDEDIADIIAYVRSIQREAGIEP